MSIGDVAKIIDHFRINEVGPGEWLHKREEVSSLSDKARTALNELAAALAFMARGPMMIT